MENLKNKFHGVRSDDSDAFTPQPSNPLHPLSSATLPKRAEQGIKPYACETTVPHSKANAKKELVLSKV
jgi:hypothetical protein